MVLPFTQEEFLEVFKSYNLALWPMQVVVYLLTIATLAWMLTAGSRTQWPVWILLAFFWLWNGVAYHALYFSAINKAAFGFGALFVLQSFLFVWAGIRRPDLSFRLNRSPKLVTGIVLITYAMVIYPLLGLAQGHGYPFAPSFGLAPCPTVIFTFGLLLCADGKVPMVLLIVPFLWALLGFTAALQLGIAEDIGLLIAGLVAAPLLMRGDFRPSSHAFERMDKTRQSPASR